MCLWDVNAGSREAGHGCFVMHCFSDAKLLCWVCVTLQQTFYDWDWASITALQLRWCCFLLFS